MLSMIICLYKMDAVLPSSDQSSACSLSSSSSSSSSSPSSPPAPSWALNSPTTSSRLVRVRYLTSDPWWSELKPMGRKTLIRALDNHKSKVE